MENKEFFKELSRNYSSRGLYYIIDYYKSGPEEFQKLLEEAKKACNNLETYLNTNAEFTNSLNNNEKEENKMVYKIIDLLKKGVRFKVIFETLNCSEKEFLEALNFHYEKDFNTIMYNDYTNEIVAC